MKRGLITLTVLLGVSAVLWLKRDRWQAPPIPHVPPAVRYTPPGTSPIPDKPPLPHPVLAEAEKLNSPDQNAADDIAILAVLLGEYRRNFKENPVGDNAEITAALQGQNPKRLAYLPSSPAVDVNSAGELTDRWDSPYFFHAISGTQMEILSAGPDREWHTADDVRGDP